MFKNAKRILAIALVIIMSLATVWVVSAELDPGTPDNPGRAAITKRLVTPEGTYVPSNMTFTFNIVPHSFNGIEVGEPEFPASPFAIPELGDDGVTTITVGSTTGTTANGITTRYIEGDELLSNITWPSTGVFAFTVSEAATTAPYVMNANNPDLIETMVFSPAEYRLYVYVAFCDDEEVYYVRYVYGIVTIEDPNDDLIVGDKVDPNPGDPSITGDFSEMVFQNAYTRTYEHDDPEDGPLYVSKTVTGSFGSLIREFEFSVTITLDEMFGDFPTFTGNILREDGTVRVANVSFANGDATTVELAHGERLVFDDLPVGTQWRAVETAVIDYNTTIIVSGTVANPASETLGDANNSVLDTGTRPVLVDGSFARFTNDNDREPPTGLNLSNPSVVALALLAVGSLAAFIVIKARKAKRYN